MRQEKIKAGVIGWPVGHSLSPRVHNYWLQDHHLNGTYEAFAIESENLSNRLKGLVNDGYCGLNVTVPHKQAVLEHLHSISDQAQRIGAVNTIVIDENGHLNGSNTDGFGFIESLKQGYKDFKASKGPAVVLGAGGAARAVVVALLDEGAPQVKLINRTRQRADEIASDIGGPIQVVDWQDRSASLESATLLVNTTVLGMVGKPSLDLDLEALPGEAIVNDIVYAPLETELLKAANTRGNPTVDGIGMLLHQARPGFAAWFGIEPRVTEDLRRHVLAGIGG